MDTNLVVVKLSVIADVSVQYPETKAARQELLMDGVEKGGGRHRRGAGGEACGTGRIFICFVLLCAQHLQNLIQCFQTTLFNERNKELLFELCLTAHSFQ